MSARCNCRTDHPFPLADCGCQNRGCACFEAGQAPPLDLPLPAHLARRDAAAPVDLDALEGEAS